MVQFAGSYVLKSHDNYRPLLEKTGKIPADKIDAILQAKPTMDIKSLGGDKYQVVTVSPMRTMDKTFELGSTFSDVSPLGNKVNATVNKTGDDTWTVDMQLEDGSKSMKLTRKFSDAGVNDTCEFEGVKATIFFERK